METAERPASSGDGDRDASDADSAAHDDGAVDPLLGLPVQPIDRLTSASFAQRPPSFSSLPAQQQQLSGADQREQRQRTISADEGSGQPDPVAAVDDGSLPQQPATTGGDDSRQQPLWPTMIVDPGNRQQQQQQQQPTIAVNDGSQRRRSADRSYAAVSIATEAAALPLPRLPCDKRPLQSAERCELHSALLEGTQHRQSSVGPSRTTAPWPARESQEAPTEVGCEATAIPGRTDAASDATVTAAAAEATTTGSPPVIVDEVQQLRLRMASAVDPLHGMKMPQRDWRKQSLRLSIGAGASAEKLMHGGDSSRASPALSDAAAAMRPKAAKRHTRKITAAISRVNTELGQVRTARDHVERDCAEEMGRLRRWRIRGAQTACRSWYAIQLLVLDARAEYMLKKLWILTNLKRRADDAPAQGAGAATSTPMGRKALLSEDDAIRTDPDMARLERRLRVRAGCLVGATARRR